LGSNPNGLTKYKKMNINEKTYQRNCTTEFRTKRCLSLFGFIIVSGYESDFHRTGKWFEYVEIEQQKCLERFATFDDGWTYKYYWTDWKECWYFTKFTKK
jgi:hypothetical protein